MIAASGKPVLLVPYLSLPSFIRQDLDTLQAAYRVELADCRTVGGILRAARQVRGCDLLLCWFGSLRYLPLVAAARFHRKPVCIIAGGYDVAARPDIQYGTMASPLPRMLGRWLFRQADAVAAFSRSAGREALEHALVRPERLSVIPLGYDAPADHGLPKEPFVLSVGNIDESTLRRKGWLTLAHLSARMPGVRFVLAGGGTPAAVAQLRAIAGPNLELPGRVSDAQLIDLYRRAIAYIQPSEHEGFGSAVAEAMLYDCIPVVTNGYSLPEVVGDCGLYAAAGDLPALERETHRVLSGSFTPPEPPRQRILREFPLAARQTALLALVGRQLARA